MKTFAELGTQIGELVEQKNAAYGSSFAKCGDYLRLLFPDGLTPDRYDDALLLARDFDKSMRIATDRDAFGESPWEDKAGYGILGAHMHQRKKEDCATWRGNANGPDAESSSKGDRPGSAAQPASETTTTSRSVTPAPEPSPQPASSSATLPDASASGATADANPPKVDLDVHSRAVLDCLSQIPGLSIGQRLLEAILQLDLDDRLERLVADGFVEERKSFALGSHYLIALKGQLYLSASAYKTMSISKAGLEALR